VGQYRRADGALAVLLGNNMQGAVDADERPVVGEIEVERGIPQRLTKKEEVALGARGGAGDQRFGDVGVAFDGVRASGRRAEEDAGLAGIEAERNPKNAAGAIPRRRSPSRESPRAAQSRRAPTPGVSRVEA